MFVLNLRRVARAFARRHGTHPSGPDERGATLVEYALLLALIAVVAIGALIFLGNTASNTLTNVAANINSHGSSGGGGAGAPAFTTPTGASGATTFTADSSTDTYTFAATNNPTFAASKGAGQTGLPGGVTFTAGGLLTDNGADPTGTYTFTVTATNTTGNSQVDFTLTINPAPQAITSAENDTVTPPGTGHTSFTFTVTTSGSPTPAISVSNFFGSGAGDFATFTDHGNGTATISSNDVDQGNAGSYSFTISAKFGTGPGAKTVTQSFTLIVAVAPSFPAQQTQYCFVTTGNHFWVNVGTWIDTHSASFTVMSNGAPNPALTAADTATHFNFVDNGDTTGTLSYAGSGTPTGGTLTVTATNTVGSAHQAFTIEVQANHDNC